MYMRVRVGMIAATFYLSSLILPAIYYDSLPHTMFDLRGALTGFALLQTGWVALRMLQPAWFANVLIVISIARMLAGNRVAIPLASVSVVLCSFSLLLSVVPIHTGGNIVHFGIGFYVWISSAILILAFSIFEAAWAEKPLSQGV